MQPFRYLELRGRVPFRGDLPGRLGPLVWCLAAALCGTACTTDLDVVSSGGFAVAYQALGPQFTESTGVRLDSAYGASTGGAPDSIPVRLARGETADVVILSREGLDRLVADGLVVEGSAVDLAESAIGMAVPAGHPLPDIGTVEAFRQTLLDAESIAYSASVSGTYLSTELFPRLGLADALAAKSTRVVSERVGDVVARGDAVLGFQQVSELLPIAGIQYVGEIPAELQKITVFSAGVTTRARHPDAAAALIAYLASAAAAPTIRASGLRPVGRKPPVVKAPLHSNGAASRLSGVARRSHMADVLPPRALPAARIVVLGATRGFTTGC